MAGATHGNGQVFIQTLTVRQQTDQLRSVKGAELPVDLTYTYTPRSQIASINDQTVPNIDQAFTYDGIGRLTASTGPWGNGTFQYDGLGNLRQRAVGARTVGMSYNAANQLSAHTDTALAVPAPVSMTALYDGASRRVKQVAGGVTRYSVYDAGGGLIEIDEVGGAKTDYIRASGMTLARIAGSTVTWLHHDHLGSAVAGTNSAGAVVWRESEQPFGEDWTTAAANDNQAGYTGHVEDAATGLTYMQARYYDPVIGRFLSIDPVGFTPGKPSMFNRYAYAANDPVNIIDKFGMEPTTCFDKDPKACEAPSGALEGASAAIAREGIGSQKARSAYLAAVRQLPKNASEMRSKLKELARRATPPATRAAIEKIRPSTNAPAGSGGTANRTNAGADKLANRLGTVGKLGGAVGIATGVYRIAEADDKPAEAARVVGAGIGGAIVGSQAGAVAGSACGPWCAGGGAVVGGIAGGIGGDQAVQSVQELVPGIIDGYGGAIENAPPEAGPAIHGPIAPGFH